MNILSINLKPNIEEGHAIEGQVVVNVVTGTIMNIELEVELLSPPSLILAGGTYKKAKSNYYSYRVRLKSGRIDGFNLPILKRAFQVMKVPLS